MSGRVMPSWARTVLELNQLAIEGKGRISITRKTISRLMMN